ncbi:B-cell receptor CD22-like [Leuresthes tenuis]|uniref:B-cell receptor CD22-like n=1 Tax=Leuresthes tenuis TaxID=355514 RepID=UPI003B5014E4
MCAEQGNLKWTLMLLILEGVLCSAWNVEYRQQHICAVRGSSAIIPCSFTYPDKEFVESVKWGHERHDIFNGPFLYDSSSDHDKRSQRFQYIGDKKHNCSLKIHQVEHNDTGRFVFRFITTGDKFSGRSGSTLKIVDLNISITKHGGNKTVKEGDSVNLTCINSCDDGKPSAFNWFKNGQSINEGPVVYLRNMSSTNSGNYTCSLNSHSGTTSEVMRIDVEYSPKNTSVSVTPSAVVDPGNNVTLICSSHGNPPVENYTWFKIHSNNITAVSHQAEYNFRSISQGDDGQYLCTATNEHGSHNSSVVTLNVRAHNKRRILIIISALHCCVAVSLIAIAVAAIRRFWKKRSTSPETDCEVESQNAIYVNLPAFDSSQKQERSLCEPELVYATVNINTKRKTDMVQQMDSHDDGDASVIYSTVSRTQPLKPSYTEP